MDTITIEQIKEIAPSARINLWERGSMSRHYINIDGAKAKFWWAEGKLHYQPRRGIESDDAIAIMTALVGCNLTEVYRDGAVADYVVVER